MHDARPRAVSRSSLHFQKQNSVPHSASSTKWAIVGYMGHSAVFGRRRASSIKETFLWSKNGDLSMSLLGVLQRRQTLHWPTQPPFVYEFRWSLGRMSLCVLYRAWTWLFVELDNDICWSFLTLVNLQWCYVNEKDFFKIENYSRWIYMNGGIVGAMTRS